MFSLSSLIRNLVLLFMVATLSGCFGGTLAQQLARSIAVQGADKITSDAVDAQLRKDEEARNTVVLKDTVPDEYWIAFVNSGFLPRQDTLPVETDKPQPQKTETPKIEISTLVRVELWSFLIGEERRQILDEARNMSITNMHPAKEWQDWRVATGAVKGEKNNVITFLIPPDFGKIHSGELALVELAGLGSLNIARYPTN